MKRRLKSMNKQIKKLISITAAAFMAAGMLQSVSFAANAPFSADFSEEISEDLRANVNDFAGYNYTGTRVEGLSGRDEGDMAYQVLGEDLPPEWNKAVSVQMPFYDNATYSDIGSDVITMEFVMKYSAGSDRVAVSSYSATNPGAWSWWCLIDWVKFENGKIYVADTAHDGATQTFTDTGMTAKPDEWYRIVVEANREQNKSVVYVNGHRFELTNLSGVFLGFRWTQVQSVMNGNAAETRDVSVTVDDINIYAGPYVQGEGETVSYSASGFGYNESMRGFLIQEPNTTVTDIFGAIDTDCEMYMLESLSSNKIKNSGVVEDGNVVVIKSPDGKTLEYLHIYATDESRIINEDQFGAESTYTMFGEETYAGKTVDTGIYGKADNNYSFDMYTENAPGNAELANRYNFMAYEFPYSAESFTAEFSIAMEGDFDAVKFITRSNYTGTADKGYQEPVAFAKDGTITFGGTKAYPDTFKQKQWYRIAITVYPGEGKYDLYFNNEKVVEKGWLAMSDAFWKDSFDITSFEWFQIQPVYSKLGDDAAGILRNGHVYVDDTITYYGTYMESEDNIAELASDVYEIDKAAGTVTVPADTDLGTFVENVDFGNADAVIYTDNTYSAESADWVDPGNVLVLTSLNGKVHAYYTVVSEQTEDEFKVGEIAINKDGANVTASVDMHVPAGDAAKNAVFALAAYDESGALAGVDYVTENDITGDKTISAALTLSDSENVSVKAMLWDENMKPYVSAEAK